MKDKYIYLTITCTYFSLNFFSSLHTEIEKEIQYLLQKIAELDRTSIGQSTLLMQPKRELQNKENSAHSAVSTRGDASNYRDISGVSLS